jgi:beta-lactamase regulating signal transducer with metallopeptidase domain
MIAIWMAYALVTGALVALMCALVERIARAAHRATRGIWLGGMLAMLLLAAGAAPESLMPRTVSPSRWAAAVQVETGPAGRPRAQDGREGRQGLLAPMQERVGRWILALHDLLAAARVRLSGWDGPLLALWALAAAFLAGVLTHASLEGRRLRHGLEPRDVAGSTVLLTHGVGPSAVGIGRPAILLPSWALELDEALLTLVLRHEREHVDALDPALLLLALLGVVLLPWHLPLWWSWGRLRLAIEVDCDRRVLRAHPGVRRYAQLLLLTAQRAPEVPWASRAVVTVAAPLRPHASHLAQRISAMTHPRTSRLLLRAALAAPGVVALAALLLALPTPRQARAQQAAAQERAIVRLTSVGSFDWDPERTSILVFTTGGAEVGIGADPPAPLSDTLRLHRVPAITADVTDGEVHVQVSGPGRIKLGGTVTGGPALTLSATGRHIVLEKGGVGIRPNG